MSKEQRAAWYTPWRTKVYGQSYPVSRGKLAKGNIFLAGRRRDSDPRNETETALTSNRSEGSLWRCLISQTKGRSGERPEIHNPRAIGLIYRCSRTDMGPRPHEALQQAPGCWTRGSCVVEEHRVSSLCFLRYIHPRPLCLSYYIARFTIV